MSRPRSDEVGAIAGPVVSLARPAPEVSQGAFLASHDTPRIHWASPDGLEVAGAGAAAILAADGEDRINAIRARADELLATVDHDGPVETRPRLFGGFSFTDSHTEASPWNGFDPGLFVLPKVQLTSYGGQTWVSIHEAGPEASVNAVERRLSAVIEDLESLPDLRPAGEPPGVVETVHHPDESGWRAQVETALERIERGELQKVVLAQTLRAELAGRPNVPDLLERVRRGYEDCFRFLIEPKDGGAFFGAPPERLVRLHGRTVETEALAGSVPRGETQAEDAELAARLREDHTLRTEQELVTETIEAALSPLGNVEVGDREIRRLSNIQHLRTPIEMTLREAGHVLDLVAELHPTPAVGGLPPEAALATIREIEPFERGWYAAPVGWMDADGNGEFAVAIRSAVAAEQAVTLFAGNGIVAGSKPSIEWTELQQKYRPILDELR
ncbi:MAG: isochorismate synthase MenF [Halobacteriaceae archaeon]